MIERPKNNPRNRNSGSQRPKKFKTQKSSSKVLASLFWDKDRILLVDYLEKGATITEKYHDASTSLRTSRQSSERNFSFFT
jgi:hypothetical protein